MDAGRRQEIIDRYQAHSRRLSELAARHPDGRTTTITVEDGRPKFDEGKPTHREIEVLQLAAAGLNNPEIAQRLFLSEETVKTHIRRLLMKLQARSRAQAVAIGLRRQLID